MRQRPLSSSVMLQMKVLPATCSNVLRWTLVALAVACLVTATRYLQFAIGGEPLYGVVAVVFWVPLAIGLWLLKPVARLVATGVLWFVVVVVPLGTINPFAAMDELGPNPPPVWELVVFWVAPWVVPALFAIHVLGRYKAEFQRQPGSAA